MLSIVFKSYRVPICQTEGMVNISDKVRNSEIETLFIYDWLTPPECSENRIKMTDDLKSQNLSVSILFPEHSENRNVLHF